MACEVGDMRFQLQKVLIGVWPNSRLFTEQNSNVRTFIRRCSGQTPESREYFKVVSVKVCASPLIAER